MATIVFLLAISSLLLLIKCWQYRSALTSFADSAQHADLVNIVDVVSDGYFDVDLTAGLYELSGNWYQSTGYTRADLPDQFTDLMLQIVHPADVSTELAVITSPPKPNAQGITAVKSDYRLRHADGHWIWMHSAGQVFFDNDGVPVRLVAALTDISTVKKNEKTLHEGQVLAGLREYRFDAINHTVAFGPAPVRGNYAN